MVARVAKGHRDGLCGDRVVNVGGVVLEVGHAEDVAYEQVAVYRVALEVKHAVLLIIGAGGPEIAVLGALVADQLVRVGGLVVQVADHCCLFAGALIDTEDLIEVSMVDNTQEGLVGVGVAHHVGG